jgi:hypothetical protein
MKKSLLIAAIAALFAAQAFAQTSAPGEDKSAVSKPATKTEKAAAKNTRKAEGNKAAKASQPGDDKPATAATAPKATKSEKQTAKAKRKSDGSDATKMPKDQTTGAGSS